MEIFRTGFAFLGQTTCVFAEVTENICLLRSRLGCHLVSLHSLDICEVTMHEGTETVHPSLLILLHHAPAL